VTIRGVVPLDDLTNRWAFDICRGETAVLFAEPDAIVLLALSLKRGAGGASMARNHVERPS
jgi:hypothetical protein